VRVLIVSHACVMPINREKVEALARRPGLEITLLAPRRWRVGNRMYSAGAGGERGYRFVPGEVLFNGRIGAHFYRSGLLRALRESRPEVVHLEQEPWSFAAGQVVAALAPLRPRPALVLFSWENMDLPHPWYYRAIERAVLRRADLLIAGGVTSRARLQRLGADPGRIVRLHQFGLDPGTFRPPAPGERSPVFTVGFAGRLVREKGVDVLVRALGALGGEWRALLVGDGAQRPELEALASSLGIRERMEFTGWVDHHGVAPYLRRMHAMVFLSRSTPTWTEQFGRPLIEAMSCGAVPVGSDSGEIPHVVGGEGLIVPEDDAAALTAALRRLRDEPGLRDRLEAVGRARILREFTWETLAERTSVLYERAAAARSGSGR